jgi:predicted NBD/HSP70 family sugar kinase
VAHHPVAPRLPPASPAGIDVLERILRCGPIPRVEIARQTALSPAAVTKAVAPLIEAGFVTFDGVRGRPNASGRPVTPLRIVPDAVSVVGIKVTTDEVIGVATDFGAAILATERRSLPRPSPEQVTRTVEVVTNALVRLLGPAARRLIGVGVSVSGDVDAAAGVVRHSPLLGWRDVPLGATLAGRLGRPVRVDNDVRALTVSEQYFGVGVSDVNSFAIVTLGSGIGCGLYVNGDVVSGAFGVAGEIGHLPLADAGLTCTCGRVDCVETVASSDAIVRAVRRATRRPALDIAAVVELAHAGNRHAVAAFDRAATVIGHAIAVVANVTGPRVIVIEGEAVTNFDVYEAKLRETFASEAFGAAAGCRLELRPHTFDAWARGAAASAIRAYVRREALGAG